MPIWLPLVLFLAAVERGLVGAYRDFMAERALWLLSILEQWQSPRCLVVSIWTRRCWEAAGTGCAAIVGGRISVVLLSGMSRTVEPDQQGLLVAELSLEAAVSASKGNFWGHIALSLFQLSQYFFTFHPRQERRCENAKAMMDPSP